MKRRKPRQWQHPGGGFGETFDPHNFHQPTPDHPKIHAKEKCNVCYPNAELSAFLPLDNLP